MCTFRASCYSRRLSCTLVLILVQGKKKKREKKWGLGWEKSRLPRYDIRAEGALGTAQYNCDSDSKKIGYFICNVSLKRINSKQKYVRLTFFVCLFVVIVFNI